VSVFAYFSAGKSNSSVRLRDALKLNTAAARPNLQTPPADQGQSVSPDLCDPILQYHCRTATAAARPIRKR
jgi:hypothetical protein